MRPLGPASRPATTTARRDPAPSRTAYRMHRLWLTPIFRTTLRVGLPAFALTFGVGLYLADADRRGSLSTLYTDLQERVKNRPEFLITLLSVEGASPELSDAIRAKMALALPQSSLDLDLEAIRGTISKIDAVADVQLRIQSGGVLQAIIHEREPALVWRTEEGVYLLDEEGHLIAEIGARADRADLPLVTGTGADDEAVEALQIFASAGPLLPRLRGLVRMGERRWDIVLDRDQRIHLPVEQPIRALERLIALDHAQDVLERDVLAVDLRLQNRPSLRLAPFALTEMRRLRGITTSENDL